MASLPARVLSLSLLVLLLVPATLLAAWDAGVEAYRSGRFAEAAQAFQEVVNQSPDAPQGHYMLGLSLVAEGKPVAAISPLRRALELNPADVGTRLGLAQAQVKAEDGSSAVATLKELDSAALAGQNRVIYFQLLAKAAESMEPAAALPVLRGAVSKEPKDAGLRHALGLVAEKLGDIRLAQDALGAAYVLDSSKHALGRQSVLFTFDLARASEGDERVAWYLKGAEIAKRLHAADPSPRNKLLFGEAEMGSRRFAEAETLFESVRKADPSAPLPYVYLGRCALAQERAEEALKHLEEATQRLGEKPLEGLPAQIHASRGLALHHLERFDEAAQAYGEAGNAKKVAEMQQLAEAQRQNFKNITKCKLQREELEVLLEESSDLKGTDTYRELEGRYRDVLRICADLFA